jgi:hypothetical protein
MNYRKALEALSALSMLVMPALLAGCTASASASTNPPDNGTSSCSADQTVTGCSGSSTGYSCTGSDTPEDSDSTLECSVGIAGNAGSTLFCCLGAPSTANSCAPDETVSGCAGGSYGFSCTVSTDNPMDAYSDLTCSTGVAGNAGSTLFCCTD